MKTPVCFERQTTEPPETVSAAFLSFIRSVWGLRYSVVHLKEAVTLVPQSTAKYHPPLPMALGRLPVKFVLQPNGKGPQEGSLEVNPDDREMVEGAFTIFLQEVFDLGYSIWEIKSPLVLAPHHSRALPPLPIVDDLPVFHVLLLDSPDRGEPISQARVGVLHESSGSNVADDVLFVDSEPDGSKSPDTRSRRTSSRLRVDHPRDAEVPTKRTTRTQRKRDGKAPAKSREKASSAALGPPVRASLGVPLGAGTPPLIPDSRSGIPKRKASKEILHVTEVTKGITGDHMAQANLEPDCGSPARGARSVEKGAGAPANMHVSTRPLRFKKPQTQ